MPRTNMKTGKRHKSKRTSSQIKFCSSPSILICTSVRLVPLQTTIRRCRQIYFIQCTLIWQEHIQVKQQKLLADIYQITVHSTY